jgi:hypothetical protein
MPGSSPSVWHSSASSSRAGLGPPRRCCRRRRRSPTSRRPPGAARAGEFAAQVQNRVGGGRVAAGASSSFAATLGRRPSPQLRVAREQPEQYLLPLGGRRRVRAVGGAGEHFVQQLDRVRVVAAVEDVPRPIPDLVGHREPAGDVVRVPGKPLDEGARGGPALLHPIGAVRIPPPEERDGRRVVRPRAQRCDPRLVRVPGQRSSRPPGRRLRRIVQWPAGSAGRPPRGRRPTRLRRGLRHVAGVLRGCGGDRAR